MSTEEDDDLKIVIASDGAISPPIPYLQKLITISSMINMWPNYKNKNPFLYHAKVWTVIFICMTLIFSFGVQIVKEFRNLDLITALIDLVTVFISGIFRYIYIYVRGKKYLELVSLIHNKFIHYPLLTERRGASLERYYKLANRLILAYSTFTFFWIVQIVSVPIISYAWTVSTLPDNVTEKVPYPMPYLVYAPFDYQTQPTHAVFYVYQTIGFMVYGWIYVVVDSFWYMVILLTIGQFVLIKDSLNTISDILKKNEAQDQVALLKEGQIRKVEAALKKCIAHHQFMRKFVHTVDDISNPNILVDSLHAVISIGFILLDVTISINTGDWNRVMYSLEYFITSITHMFFFDWLGNELSEKEEELAEAVYDIPWYKCPRQRTTFLLMSIQSRRPYKLTGGRMYKLSLEFFTSTVKAVFSYFTFLFQMRNGR